MSALRARWATGPEDMPAEGEAVGRAVPLYRVQPNATGGLTINSSLDRPRMVMTVEAADGRKLTARFSKDADAPLIEADAPADLRDALNSLWRKRKKSGPPPGDGLDLSTLRQALRDWDGPWPPPEDQITPYSARRVRQVLYDADTSWEAETATRPPR